MNMIIREAKESDIETIADFQLQMAAETEGKQLDLVTVRSGVERVLQDSQCGFYLVCQKSSQVVGSLLITYEWSDWRNCNLWYLQSVYVSPDFRGQGIFKEMYRGVVQRARSSGSNRIRLYVEQENGLAQKVYEALGMNRLPYLMYEADLD
jgi:ribosomal protein S18 acetylase RimI-like enzyme